MCILRPYSYLQPEPIFEPGLARVFLSEWCLPYLYYRGTRFPTTRRASPLRYNTTRELVRIVPRMMNYKVCKEWEPAKPFSMEKIKAQLASEYGVSRPAIYNTTQSSDFRKQNRLDRQSEGDMPFIFIVILDFLVV